MALESARRHRRAHTTLRRSILSDVELSQGTVSGSRLRQLLPRPGRDLHTQRFATGSPTFVGRAEDSACARQFAGNGFARSRRSSPLLMPSSASSTSAGARSVSLSTRLTYAASSRSALASSRSVAYFPLSSIRCHRYARAIAFTSALSTSPVGGDDGGPNSTSVPSGAMIRFRPRRRLNAIGTSTVIVSAGTSLMPQVPPVLPSRSQHPTGRRSAAELSFHPFRSRPARPTAAPVEPARREASGDVLDVTAGRTDVPTAREWERLLTEHYLHADGPFGSSPLTYIDATPAELAVAADLTDISHDAVQEAFVSIFTRRDVRAVLGRAPRRVPAASDLRIFPVPGADRAGVGDRGGGRSEP